MSATPTPIVGQAPINLGPLTTAFAMPPECNVAMAHVERVLDIPLMGAKAATEAYLGQMCSRGNPAAAASCWPPMTAKVAAMAGYYSPGLECPVGYATACSATGGARGLADWPTQFKLAAGETAVGCCPK